jgi:hypothetical protein
MNIKSAVLWSHASSWIASEPGQTLGRWADSGGGWDGISQTPGHGMKRYDAMPLEQDRLTIWRTNIRHLRIRDLGLRLHRHQVASIQRRGLARNWNWQLLSANGIKMLTSAVGCWQMGRHARGDLLTGAGWDVTKYCSLLYLIQLLETWKLELCSLKHYRRNIHLNQ